MKINRISFVNEPVDIFDGFLDVFVSLENGEEYWLEVTTPKTLASIMEETNEKFIEPLYPFIIVQELTPTVIKKAIELFISEREDAFWFKLYHSIPLLTIDDVNLIIDRNRKEMEAENEEEN